MINIRSNFNPLIQTFFVPQEQFRNGIYVDSVDLFFQSKDTILPVMIHLGPTVESLPEYVSRYKDSEVILYPSSVKDDNTASTATNFKFERPIYLSPGLHYLAIKTNSNLYNIFTAVQGEGEFGTGRRINKSPYTGDLYYASYDTSSKISNEDIKFVMYYTLFNDNSTGSVVLKNTFESFSTTVEQPLIDQEDYNKYFDLFNVVCDDTVFNGTKVNYSYKKTSEGGNLDSSFTPMITRLNTPITRSKLNNGTFYVNASLQTFDRYVSPVIDSDRCGAVFIKNIVNESSDGEDGYIGGSAKSKYVTKVIELLPDIDANDLAVYAYLKMPTGTDVKVYYKACASSINISTNVKYVEMIRSALGTPNTESYVEYKFTTPNSYALPDQSNFNKFQIKIVMLSSTPHIVPTVKDFRAIALND